MDGIEVIKTKIASLSGKPGVYRMLGESGAVLYVGKAKNLKKRVTSYTIDGKMSARIRRMVFETRELIVVETATEMDALLLEISLIKSLKPKYNILFRDDTSYPYIHITDHAQPKLTHYRGKKTKKGHFFGPYPDAKVMYKAIEELEKVFQLRTCSDSEFNSRTRPCLKYDIKRCSAPCVGKINPADYQKSVDDTAAFLSGKGQVVQQTLADAMSAAAAALDYEQAARYRDRIAALNRLMTTQYTSIKDLGDMDVVGLVLSGGKAAVQIFMYRGGVHNGNILLYPTIAPDDTPAEIIKTVLMGFYDGRMQVPGQILASAQPADHSLIADILSERSGRKVSITVPQRGDKTALVSRAVANAETALARKLAASQSWRQQMQAFGGLLGRSDMNRIEAFDISNIQGKHPVASLVVAGPEGMVNNAYRKFAITGQDTPDDYAMMREALTRRYQRVKREVEAGQAALPDVILVDGGKGHLRVLSEVMIALDLSGPALCAIAKGPERDKGLEVIYQHGRGALDVPYNSPLKFMLQMIRDESHRTAIGYHRAKRSKETFVSVLDGIPGIGPKRKKALLSHFGSAAAVKEAAVPDLIKVDGISREQAQVIYDYLR